MSSASEAAPTITTQPPPPKSRKVQSPSSDQITNLITTRSLESRANDVYDLSVRASELNRKVIDNEGDGNCLFLAVADQLSRTKEQLTANELRSSAILNLRECPYIIMVRTTLYSYCISCFYSRALFKVFSILILGKQRQDSIDEFCQHLFLISPIS